MSKAIQATIFGDGNPVAEKGARLKKRLATIQFSEPLAEPMLRVLSLGMGLQSVTLAFMSARGELPMLDAAIFADTGGEKRATYQYLEYLRERVPFPVHVVRREGPSLGEHALANVGLSKNGRQQLPLHTTAPDGSKGMLPKQCNSDWKKRVVHREIIRMVRGRTEEHQLPKVPVVEEWLGMTRDELERLSTSERAFIHHRYPLVEEPLRYVREQCGTWLDDRQICRPPRSACIYCPFQRSDEWRDMRDNHPIDFADACDFDDATRVPHLGFEGQAFVHSQRVPLRDADLSTQEDHGQESIYFGCGEGICGT
jgi:hypothetical protein